MDNTGDQHSMKQTEERKRIINEYFRLLGMGQFKEGLRFFSSDCKTHNPYVSGGMNELTEAMIAASKEMSVPNSQPYFGIDHMLVERNMAAVHTRLQSSKTNPGEGGLRQVHLFRFEADKIVEYWDITQQILPSMPNASGAF